MASVNLVVSASTRLARIALGELELFVRRTSRRIENRLDDIRQRSSRMWSRLTANATELLSQFGIIATRTLSRVGDAFVSAGSSGLKFGSILTLLMALLVPLVVTIGNLLGLLILIPGGILGAITAIGVLTAGFHGMGDAISAGLSGDLEKFEEALAKLSPEAASTARHIVFLAAGFRHLRSLIQESLFAGVATQLQKLNDRFFPTLAKHLPRIAAAFNQMFREVSNWLVASGAMEQVDIILRGITGTTENLLKIIRPLVQIFLDLAEVGTGRINRMTRGLGEGAEQLAAWVRHMKESGKLSEWLEKALDTVKQLGRIIGNVGEMFAAIFRHGQQDGETMLDTIERLTQQLADFLNSNRGKAFIDMLGQITKAAIMLITLAISLSIAWSSWFNGMKAMWNGLIDGAAKAFNFIWNLAVSVANGIAKAFSKIPGFGGMAPQQISMPSNTGSFGSRAAGGPASGVTMINERGAEILDLPNGTMVYPAGQSAGMMNKAMSGPTQIIVTVAGSGDELLNGIIKMLRFDIRSAAGGDVVSYFGGA